MLYDDTLYEAPPPLKPLPAREQQTLLDRWIDYLATKPEDARYEWRDAPRCAVGEFYGGDGWVGKEGYGTLNCIARGSGSHTDEADWTYGKCLARAKMYRQLMPLGWFGK